MSNEAVEEARGRPVIKADKDAAHITNLMTIQSRGLTKDKLDNHSCNFADSLIERLELHILETKTGHDGLYAEMLNISKQLLSMNIINQENLDNFVFSYGKYIVVEKQQLLPKKVFSPQITESRRERIIPLYKDETWSADLIDKSSLST